MTTDTVTPCLLIGAYGLFTGCTDGVGKAWISGLVSQEYRAGTRRFQGGTGLGILVAGLWAGFLWGANGRVGVFAVVGEPTVSAYSMSP